MTERTVRRWHQAWRDRALLSKGPL